LTELASIRFVNEGDIVIAMVTGEIDLSNASRLLMTVTDAVANEATGLIMDLSDVAFMDSTGVQMLLELAKRLEWRDQAMRLVVPDDSHIRKVLMITGFEGVVAVDGSLGLARAHFANQEDDQ
jgi:anti-sigma B factor antagonist